MFYCLGSIIGVWCFLHLSQVLGGTWAQCLMDVTPDAIVPVVFLWKCCPKIPKTKAADMEGKIETLERIKSSENSHSATLMKGGWGGGGG